MRMKEPWEMLSLTKAGYEDFIDDKVDKDMIYYGVDQADRDDLKRARDSFYKAMANGFIKDRDGKSLTFDDTLCDGYARFCGKNWTIGDKVLFNELVRDEFGRAEDLMDMYQRIGDYDPYLDDKVRAILGSGYSDYMRNDYLPSDFDEFMDFVDKDMPEPTEEEIEGMYQQSLDDDVKQYGWRSFVERYIKDYDVLSARPDDIFGRIAESIDAEVDNIDSTYGDAMIDADTQADDVYTMVEIRRMEYGLKGDEPDIPASVAKELYYGKDKDAIRQELKSEQEAAAEGYKDAMESLYKDVCESDIALYQMNIMPEGRSTVASESLQTDPQFVKYAETHYGMRHPMISARYSHSFDNLLNFRNEKNLPWTKDCNDEYNNSILSEYAKFGDSKVFSEENKRAFFKKVYDSTLQSDSIGNKPYVYTTTMDAMPGYEAYQEERIDAELVTDNEKTDSKTGVDFSRSVVKKDSDKAVQRETSLEKVDPIAPNKPNQKSSDGRGNPKRMLNSFENGVSNPDYDFDEWDDEDDDNGDFGNR